ncbi:UDP-N-acetylglucosamine--N-acetylmuramyl-(pentapeptide) pyrophosphoryl-undecaprenol N-acetylglucosamine transferase [Methanobacterium sp.]|uniref:UDP-N-acetylglucosamine--N-acetylmuramyl- (pentapeptide) pyrophosphoryl-undecaprenol N-acetylglucosamine transferase n=1 Tax=Methanobacterium sp. TaxID=2164 RepID=UPI0025E33966|nr:UDP-N-acetylglucosamine--N-acetylmuramyl-(pentapeptide) pyrophosphoryl-undecaprenol N-acetylglucosamine transferase [Methanobacterium sp.]MBI5458980.1 UDP-N-acetylglucosamine--N-acetylmuramyl-(pentapeptide) pyrophosphoryl-undecaprenol N-acetylglucosamine transferase [Methanobacterium sp.]
MKVLLIPCGIGMGHTSRSVALAQKLEADGDEVLFASYGSGYQMLNEYSDYDVVKLPTIKFYGSSGELNFKHTALKSIDAPYIFLKSIYHESRIIKEFNPDVVVSDSHYSVPITCKVLGIPCVLVSNDLAPELKEVNQKDRTLEYLENGLQRFIKDVSRLCDSIIIPDIQNSYEVPAPIRHRVNFTGPILKMDTHLMASKKELRQRFRFGKSEKMVMATVGGSEFGNKLLKLLHQAAPDLDCDRIILVTGPQIKLDLESSPRIICKRFLGDIMEWMKLSDFLVSLAGHTTSMEIASLGIPSLMVPIENHPEQLKNAMKMKNYGIAHLENMGTLTSEKLSENINHLLEDQDLKKNAEKTRNIFSQYNGTEDAVSIIRSCVETGDEFSD